MLYGSTIFEFSTLGRTAKTMLRGMLGDIGFSIWDGTNHARTAPVWAGVLFWIRGRV